MDEKNIKKIAQDTFDASMKKSQYNVGPVPFHTHNGVDSSQLAFSSITGLDAEFALIENQIAVINTTLTSLQSQITAIPKPNSIVYFPFQGFQLTAGQILYYSPIGRNSSEIVVQVAAPVSGIINNLYMKTTSSQPGDGGMAAIFRHSGSTTTLAATAPAGALAGTFTDTTHSFTVSAGDTIDIQLANVSSSLSATIAICYFGFTAT